MKVLHLPLEVGNQVSELCVQLRLLGVQAAGLNWRKSNYIGSGPAIVASDAYEMANALEHLFSIYDILHYHTGYTIYPDKSDVALALHAGKKAVMHHRGNDVRHPEAARRRNPYVYTGSSLPASQIIDQLRYFSKHLSTAIVQDYELYDYVSDYYKQVHILPRLIDTSIVKPAVRRQERGGRPLVVHAPTSREFKGTEVVQRVVHSLQKEIPFDFVLLERMRQKEVWQMIAQADLVIDQVLCGAYGNISVEAMACEVPVVCFIRPDIYARMNPKPPIASAHPGQLYDQLKELVKDGERRRRLGKEGRAYVQHVHEASKVARQLTGIYQSL
ncbi:glycosyltransferase family 1 protein [Xylanibacillus composti]|nr:glycosyltransferase family 1 protein [Xylanibacillus composti]